MKILKIFSKVPSISNTAFKVEYSTHYKRKDVIDIPFFAKLLQKVLISHEITIGQLNEFWLGYIYLDIIYPPKLSVQ